jgi:hypothetical protein
MPILDLSLVTKTLLTLMERRVKAGLTKVNQPNVANNLLLSALSTDKLTGDQTIGLYLYHAVESGHTKNPPPVSADLRPIQFTPMGLELYYQLTAHSDATGEAGATRVQTLFGLALKALRDFPVIDKDTVLNGAPVFPSDLQGSDDRVRITLQPIAATDAAHYWTAGSQPLRLAAYYQVSATLLEPEPAARFTGRVLRYGVQTFVRGAPRLEASRGTITFHVPGEDLDRSVEARPAEVPVGAQIEFLGSDVAGDQTTLVLRGPALTAAVAVGAEWGVTAAEDRVFAVIRRQADSEDIVPNFYSAAAKVTRHSQMPDGSIRAFSQTSNEVPFVVTPAVTTPNPGTVANADAQGVVVVQGHLFRHASFTNDTLKVVVGSEALVLNDPALQSPPPLPAPGEFEIVDATTLVPPVVLDDPLLPFVIRFRFPITGLTSGDVVPLRVLVNGAENAPRWVKVP